VTTLLFTLLCGSPYIIFPIFPLMGNRDDILSMNMYSHMTWRYNGSPTQHPHPGAPGG